MSTPLTLPAPSDPSRRYREHREGNLAQGTPQNQVWTVTLDATGGLWFVSAQTWADKVAIDQNIATSGHATCAPNASAATMQTMFENQVGVGNVTVTGGPGASGGGTPYVITFLGQMANQPVWLESSAVFLTGGGASATTVETTHGGVASASTPIGPSLSANDVVPTNGPRAREA